MSDDNPTTHLVEGAAAGNPAAISALWEHHRPRLLRMVRCHMDGRLQGRIDPEDVVQEALIVAHRRLGEYAQRRQVPFYLWLRRIAWEQMVHVQERHLKALKRTVTRECGVDGALSAWSRGKLADQVASLTTPSKIAVRNELHSRLMQEVECLSPQSREVLLLRFVEQLSLKEVAAVVGVSVQAAQMRIVRALERLRGSMEDEGSELR